MRIVFMGTPAFAVPALDALVAAGHDVIAAYTQPPRPAGRRGRADTPSPVQQRAIELGVEVRSPVRLRDAETLGAFAALDADIAVVAAYGLILPQTVLVAPRLGCLNIHASLLPRWRGAAPIHRAILAGDAQTGVCIMQMEAGLDTGPVRAEARVAVGGKSVGDLTSELAGVGSRLLIDVLSDLAAYPAVPQPEEGVTYASKVLKEELKLDFRQTAEQVFRQVRAFNPPGAWFEFAGERFRILQCEEVDADGAAAGMVTDGALTISCSAGAVRPTLIQRAGRAPMTSAELLRGFPIPSGTQL